MSLTFGCDLHPGYQAPFDFKRARRAGYRFAFVKASQGERYVPAGFREYAKRAEDSMLLGLYHFLEAGPSGRAQAEHFLDTAEKVGGPSFAGRLLAVDFEDYGERDPRNDQLFDFIKTVKAETNEHALVVYSTASFWEGGISSGPFAHYGADATWEARVWSRTEKRRYPRSFYKRSWLPWYLEQGSAGFGGVRASFHQFTWGGRVGGLYVDTDAFRGSMDNLLKLTTRTEVRP